MRRRRRPRLDRAGTLGAWLRRVSAAGLGAATAAAATGCCAPLFEEWNAGFATSTIIPARDDIATSARHDRPLPVSLCRSVCKTEVCFPVEVLGPSGVPSQAIACNDFNPGTCRDSNFFSLPSGRRTAELDAAGVEDALAAVALAEAESAADFERLATELTTHGAPHALVSRARRAARDEVAHARIVRRLAARSATHPRRALVRGVAPSTRSPRALVDLALENAALGCVGETWGALLAREQAAAAREPRVRAAMTRLASDELRHASLAFAVHAWAMARLAPPERRRVRRAASAALGRLVAAARAPISPEIASFLGTPAAGVRAELARALGDALGGALGLTRSSKAGPSSPVQPRSRAARA